MSINPSRVGVALAGAGVAAAAPALAQSQTPVTDRTESPGDFGNGGRLSRALQIFMKTVPFGTDYPPIETKTSGGYESVRVITDTGQFIQLQHMLVADHEARPS